MLSKVNWVYYSADKTIKTDNEISFSELCYLCEIISLQSVTRDRIFTSTPFGHVQFINSRSIRSPDNCKCQVVILWRSLEGTVSSIHIRTVECHLQCLLDDVEECKHANAQNATAAHGATTALLDLSTAAHTT